MGNIKNQVAFARELLGPAIEALEQQQWREIASAPQDGTDVLVWNGECHVAWCDEGCWRNGAAHQKAEGLEPSHWQPLPAPPQEIKS